MSAGAAGRAHLAVAGGERRRAPPEASDACIEARLRALLGTRAAQATVCPSEVARSLWADEAQWRAAMPRVRAVAARLGASGVVVLRRAGVELDPAAPGPGPLRVGRGARFDD